MKDYHTDPAAAYVLQILLLLFAGILCFLLFLFLRGFPVLRLVCCIAVLLCAVLFGGLLFPLWLHSVRCIVSEGRITVKSGIFLRQERSVTLHSVQFAESIHGPLHGRWGMNFILLHVCGGRLVLPFLGSKDRQEITDFLQKKGVFHAP